MAAVVCELFSRDDPAGAGPLSTLIPRLAAAIVEGLRRGVEAPLDVARLTGHEISPIVGRTAVDAGARSSVGHRSVDPLEVLEGGEVDLDPAVPWPHGDLDAGLEVVAEQLLEFEQSRRAERGCVVARRRSGGGGLGPRADRPLRRHGRTGPRRRAGASCSWNARSGVPRSARAWPMRSEPSCTYRWITGGSWSSRSMLVTDARLLPTRLATSSWVRRSPRSAAGTRRPPRAG